MITRVLYKKILKKQNLRLKKQNLSLKLSLNDKKHMYFLKNVHILMIKKTKFKLKILKSSFEMYILSVRYFKVL